MIKSIAHSIDSTLNHPERFPLGRFGIIATAAGGTLVLPILFSHAALATAQGVHLLFGEYAGAMTFATLAGGVFFSAIQLRAELEEINSTTAIKRHVIIPRQLTFS